MPEDTLNESEREAIENAWIIAPKDGPSGDDDPMYRAVAAIVAARTAALARDRDALAAKAWDEAVQAFAWARDNGPAEGWFEYVRDHNPYRAALAGPEDTDPIKYCGWCGYLAGHAARDHVPLWGGPERAPSTPGGETR